MSRGGVNTILNRGGQIQPPPPFSVNKNITYRTKHFCNSQTQRRRENSLRVDITPTLLEFLENVCSIAVGSIALVESKKNKKTKQ